jgi:hypothetical protein
MSGFQVKGVRHSRSAEFATKRAADESERAAFRVLEKWRDVG